MSDDEGNPNRLPDETLPMYVDAPAIDPGAARPTLSQFVYEPPEDDPSATAVSATLSQGVHTELAANRVSAEVTAADARDEVWGSEVRAGNAASEMNVAGDRTDYTAKVEGLAADSGPSDVFRVNADVLSAETHIQTTPGKATIEVKGDAGQVGARIGDDQSFFSLTGTAGVDARGTVFYGANDAEGHPQIGVEGKALDQEGGVAFDDQGGGMLNVENVLPGSTLIDRTDATENEQIGFETHGLGIKVAYTEDAEGNPNLQLSTPLGDLEYKSVTSGTGAQERSVYTLHGDLGLKPTEDAEGAGEHETGETHLGELSGTAQLGVEEGRWLDDAKNIGGQLEDEAASVGHTVGDFATTVEDRASQFAADASSAAGDAWDGAKDEAASLYDSAVNAMTPTTVEPASSEAAAVDLAPEPTLTDDSGGTTFASTSDNESDDSPDF